MKADSHISVEANEWCRLRCMCWWTAMEDANVVAMFDIDRYIYVFFRELALESTALCDKTYYSRVARLCKVVPSRVCVYVCVCLCVCVCVCLCEMLPLC